jgi:hypothetical protein
MLLLVQQFVFWWWTSGFFVKKESRPILHCNLIAKLIIAISKISLHSCVTLHQQSLCESLFVGVFLFAALNSCANVIVTKNQDTRRGCESQRRWYALRPVWVATCWRLCLWTSKMFTRITNLDRILHTPTCCECEQEISPNVDSQLGASIPILRIRIHMGGPIHATDLPCTL